MMPAGMFESASHVSYCMDLDVASSGSEGVPSVVRRASARQSDIGVDHCRFSISDSFLDRHFGTPVERAKPRPSFDDLCDPPSDTPEGVEFPQPASPAEFIANLNRKLARFLQVQQLPSSAQELETYGLPEDIASSLKERGVLSGDEAQVAIAFLHALSESVLSSHFERGLLRLVLTAWKRHCADPALDFWLAESLAAADTSAWNWANLPMTEAASAPSP
jgi:hypothetical protein